MKINFFLFTGNFFFLLTSERTKNCFIGTSKTCRNSQIEKNSYRAIFLTGKTPSCACTVKSNRFLATKFKFKFSSREEE